MKWNQQKSYVKYLFCSFLVCVSLILSPMSLIGSLASSTESGAITIQEQWANNVYNNFQSLIQDSLKVSLPQSEIDTIWNNYVDHCYSIWNLNENDLQSHYGHFRNYVGSQFEMEKNPDNTYNYNMSEDARTFIQDSFNTYVQNNPLSYKVASIPSYTRLNTSQFSNYTVYKSVQEIIKNCGGYALLQAPNGWGRTSDYCYLITIPKDTFEINFYGTLTGGVFTNVQMEHNWSNVATFTPNTNGVKVYNFQANRAPVEMTSWNILGNYVPRFDNVINSPSILGTTGKGHILTSLSKDEDVFVFASINAYKNYNSGNPQSYYQMSDYNGTIIPTGYQIPNTTGSYQNIVNNIESGWTAQEVLALVDRIMSQGSGSGGSGSGSDDDGWLDLGIFGDIGKAIAKVIGAIITAIASIFEEIIGIVTQVSETLLQGVIFEFLSAFIGWLPDEIIALLTALFSVAVLFALVKLIREAF